MPKCIYASGIMKTLSRGVHLSKRNIMSSDSSRDRTPPRDVIYDRCVCMYAKKIMYLPVLFRRAGFKPGNCKGECSSQGKGAHSRQKSLVHLLFQPTCSSEKTSAYENRVWIAGNGKNYFSSQDENTWEQTSHKTSKTVLEASTREQIPQLPL